jgi:hypothetical protein
MVSCVGTRSITGDIKKRDKIAYGLYYPPFFLTMINRDWRGYHTQPMCYRFALPINTPFFWVT